MVSIRLSMLRIVLVLLAIVSSRSNGATVTDLIGQRSDAIKDRCNGKMVSFLVVRPSSIVIPGQGDVEKEFCVLWEDGTLFIRATSTDRKAPTYVDPNAWTSRSSDYMKDGALVVWRTAKEYAVWSPARNESLEMVRAFYVRSDDTAESGSVNWLKCVNPVGTRSGIHEYWEFELAVGRGTIRTLREEVSTQVDASTGSVTVISSGRLSGGPSGEWRMTTDPNCDYIVRNAVLTGGQRRMPIIKAQSWGTLSVEGQIVCAAGGSVTCIPEAYDANFSDIKIRKLSNEEIRTFKEEVFHHLDSPLPAGSRIADFTGKKPVMTTVGSEPDMAQ